MTSLAVGIFYFGKKGIGLHFDIFFKKNKNVLVKSVYLTACDQDLITRLNIADFVLKDVSGVSMLAVIMGVYTRSHG